MVKLILRTFEISILLFVLTHIGHLFANEIDSAEKDQRKRFRGGEVLKLRPKSKRFKFADKNLDIDLLSQVQSPIFLGQRLQSTSVDVKGQMVVIGHNLAGEVSAGGIELYWLSKKELKKITGLYSEDFELAMVKIIDDRTIIGVGAAKDQGAAVFVFSLFDGRINLVSQTLIPGHYATSIDIQQERKQALISSGDDGGSFILDLRDLAHPSIVRAFGVDFILDGLFLGQSLLQLESSTQTQLISIPFHQRDKLITKMCDEVVEAPARMILDKGKIATNACPGFFKVLGGDHSPFLSFTILATMSIRGRGNGLDVIKDIDRDHSLYFLAQGDFGLEVAMLEHSRNHLRSLGSLENGDDGSANAVFARPGKDGPLVFVSAGQQGIRIYRVHP